MSLASMKWNPIEGMPYVKKKDINQGDLVIVRTKHYDPMSQDMDWQYRYCEYVPYMHYPEHSEFFVAKRAPIEEPTNLGSAVRFTMNRVDYVAIKLRNNHRPWYLYIRDETGELDSYTQGWLMWSEIEKYKPTPYGLG